MTDWSKKSLPELIEHYEQMLAETATNLSTVQKAKDALSKCSETAQTEKEACAFYEASKEAGAGPLPVGIH